MQVLKQLCVLSTSLCLSATVFSQLGVNLIINPGGDVVDALGTQQVSTSFYFSITDTATMFGWTVSGDPNIGSAPTTYRYDSDPNAEDYPLLIEGPFDSQGNYTGGLNLFFGGFNGDGAGRSTAFQDIDLVSFSTLIGAGSAVFELSGWLGGYYSQADSCAVSAIFLDDQGQEINRKSFGPLTPAERNFTKNLFPLETDGIVPSNAKKVRIQMDFTGGGRSLDGYVDNLYFAITPLADLNGDGCVSDDDLLEVLFAFGQSGVPQDLDGDGIVSDSDLLIVLFSFGVGC